MEKIKVGIIGPGNIGLDLLQKIRRSEYLEPAMVINVFRSKGIEYCESLGIPTGTEGIKDLLPMKDIDIVFDCTSATAHAEHAPLLREAGFFTIDLTPAAVGPYLIPAVNLGDDLLELDNVNMVTCAGQAIVPIMAAINEVADVSYGEIVACIASKSAGPGTRANIDEFTETTKTALEKAGGADKAKAIIILNPAEPPIHMRNTIHAKVKKPDLEKITEVIEAMVKNIQKYVPGYEMIMAPIMNEDVVSCITQVEGLGDYLPKYSGNLDIITCAAVETAEAYAKKKHGRK